MPGPPCLPFDCGDDGAGCTYIGLEQKMNQNFYFFDRTGVLSGEALHYTYLTHCFQVGTKTVYKPFYVTNA
jgi:hypothetical protein